MKSLKTKLILAISALIFVLFGISSFLFMSEKQRELTQDIFVNARSFAELTAPQVVANYSLYLPQKSFIYFNREIQVVFEKFQDLSSIQVASYEGELLYDSVSEKDKQYEGTPRMLTDVGLLEQLKARNPSVMTLDSRRIIYLKKSEAGEIQYVDSNEKPVPPLRIDEKISYLIQPATDQFAVVYGISYVHLQERINQTIIRGVLLGVFGVGVGIILAYLFAAQITNPLKKLTAGAGIIAQGNFQHRVEIKTRDELQTLAEAFNSMAKDLEISTKALVYKERVAKELELAAKIQRELLPKEIPKIAGLDISAGLLPAEEIGGDCYDFIKTDDNNLVMYLGDVTGHGVPSGLVVAVANALIYNYAGKSDIKELLVNVNRILKDKTSSNMFMTLVMLHWDALQKKLRFCSAGHEQMVHYHAKDAKVTLTPAGGLALGMLSQIEKTLDVHDIEMEPGDTIIVYSDGIPESWKNEAEMYGMARLKRAVSSYCDLPTAFAIRNALLADVKEFSGKWKQMDDITLLVLKRTQDGMEKTS